jgi:hypothetical protein
VTIVDGNRKSKPCYFIIGMKNYEFYSKHKSSHQTTLNPAFYTRNWWQIILPALSAVLIGPLIIYKYQRSALFSLNYYFRLLEYCFLIVVPFISFLLWHIWREVIKRNSGYSWIGKFEVLEKKSFVFYYLLLAPGNSKVKVERSLFERIHIGNFILIRRDALGGIEEIRKVNHLSSRLSKTAVRNFLKDSLKSPSIRKN